MILRRLTANFGVLSHRTLELEPGLNVIEAPNESGKSTWCAFLRVMLYGPGTGRSARSGARPDRELYAPWDGSPMEGTMDLSWEGRDVTIRRSSGPAGPMRSFSAVYTGTEQSVSALTESDAGERLTGLDAEVFRRTAFIGPAGLRVAPGPEMEKYIAAAVAAGEEGVSYTEAAGRLRAWQRRLRYRNQGRLAEQEAEAKKLESDLAALSRIDGELEELERREARVGAVYSELTDRLEASSRERERVRREARQELWELQEEMRRREREAESLRRARQASPLDGEEPDEAFMERARADSRRCARLLREGRSGPSPWPWTLCLLLAAACAAAGAAHALFFLPCAALLAAGAVLLVQARQARRRLARRTKELAALRRRYGAATPKEILAAAENYADQTLEMRSLTAAARELRAGAEDLALRQSEGDSDAPAPEKLSAAGEELRTLSAQKARLLAQRDALGDRQALTERRAALRAAHDADERTFAALSAALTELTAADEERQARFAPALSRRTAEFFRALTGGRYDALALDRELTAAVRRTGEDLPRAEAFLSRGTRDQLYLALRLALCRENDCPIVLDDALVHFDDERLGRALDVLRELGQTRQILLFTCQSREKRRLEEQRPSAETDR